MNRSPTPEAPPAVSVPARVFPNLPQTIGVLVLFVLGLLAATFFLTPLQRELPEHLWLFSVMLLGESVVVMAGFRLARWPLARVFGTLGFSTTTLRRLLLTAAGTLLLIGGVIVFVAWAFGPFEQDYLLELFELESPAEFLVLFLMVGVAAPVLEELLFRGLLLRGLVASWGVTGGVLWTAFFFALIHLSPVQAVPAFINGVVWSLVLLRTGSLGSVLFLHSLNNSFVFLLVQLTMRGGLEGEPPTETLSPIVAAMAVGAAFGGLALVRFGLSSLQPAPVRLSEFWGFAAPPGLAGAASGGAVPPVSGEPEPSGPPPAKPAAPTV